MIYKDDFIKLLMQPSCLFNLNQSSAESLGEWFGQPFAQMKGFSQENPHHCFDLLEHTCKTAASINTDGFSLHELIILYSAALFHDIGKLSTATRKNKRLVFYNHAEESVRYTQELLIQIQLPQQLINRICFLIGYHDAFINYKLPEELNGYNPYLHPITKSSVQKAIDDILSKQQKKSVEEAYTPTARDWLLLCALCQADAQAQADVVWMNGKIVDTKQNKIQRIQQISFYIQQIT